MKKTFPRFIKRIIMQTTVNNYPVPWPEELCLSNLVNLKDYRMNEFPRTSSGAIWYDVPDEKYLSWLSDYLPANLPELTPEQERIMVCHDSGAENLTPFWIGNVAGWYESESLCRPNYEFLPEFFEFGDFRFARVSEYGFTYDDYLEGWKDVLDQEELLTREELILEDLGWHLVIEEEEEAFRKYWSSFRKAGAYFCRHSEEGLRFEPPDAGWRIYLGLILQRLESRKERIKALEEFYCEWHDMMSK